jgi:hypothetical protein
VKRPAACVHARERLLAYLPHPLESSSVTLVWCAACGALGTKLFNGKGWTLKWEKPKGKAPTLAKAAAGASRALPGSPASGTRRGRLAR